MPDLTDMLDNEIQPVFDRLNAQLANTTQLTSQILEIMNARKGSHQAWPGQVNDTRQLLLDAYNQLGLIEQELEASAGHEEESRLGLEVAVDRLRNMQTILGKKGQNLAFLQAADKSNLKALIGFIVTYSPEVFQEIIEELKEEERLKLGIKLASE